MSLKTISRLILAVGLLVGYYLVPTFLGGGGSSGLGFRPGEATRIEVRTAEGDRVRVRKEKGNEWRMEGSAGVRADAGAIGALLGAMGSAEVSPLSGVSAEGGEPEIVFLRGGKELGKVVLGPRLEPFRRQAIFVDGKAREIGADLSAILGLWHEFPEPRLEDRLPLRMDGREIVAVRWENPFATYDLTRGSDVIRQVKDEGRTTDLYRWTETGSHGELEVSSQILSMIGEALAAVPAEGLAGPGEEPEVYSRMTIGTSDGGTTVAVLSASRLRDRVQFLKVLEPEESGWWTVSGVVGRRIAPDGALLFAERPALLTVAERARRIVFEREGQRVVLERPGVEWQMVEPKIPLEIYRPEPSVDDPEPLSMAESYAARLVRVALDERFVADTGERRELVAGVFDAPWARVLVETAAGERSEVLVSRPVGKTGRVFVSVDGAVGVVAEEDVFSLAPNVRDFFEKEAFSRLPVTW